MAASVLSMNLSGRFRVGGEARCVGQAVIQRLLRGTDLLFGQQAQFNLCLPGNYRMVGSPSAFIVYNCQLYSVTELRHSHCPVHDDVWNDLPPSNWTVSRVFFEQTCQEVLAVSWFTDDTVQSKRKREAIVKRLLNVAHDLSSSFGLPVLIGGSFHLSVEDVSALIRESGLDDAFRCYGYWLDSLRRSIRASSLFIGAIPQIELSRVRPRSLAGNVCLGFKNDTWRNPEDSFYWDPLSAKVTIAVSCQSGKMLVEGGTLTAVPSTPPEPEEVTPKRRRGARPRPNFDVIRTTIDNYEPNAGARKTISNFAGELDREPSFPLVATTTSRDTVDASSAVSRRNPIIGSTISQDRDLALRFIQSATKRSSSKSTLSDSDEMKELREILTRLKVGREVQIGASETARDYKLRENFLYPESGNLSGGIVGHHRGVEVVYDDLEGLSNGQFSRKLSTISESGESTCSSVVQDNGCLEKEVLDETNWNQMESDDVLDNSRHANLWQDGRRVVNRGSLEDSRDGSVDGTGDGGGSSTGLPSKQSSQDERIVEGSSDVDQDDKFILQCSLRNESVGEESMLKVSEKERIQKIFTTKESTFPGAVVPAPIIPELFEEDRLESNLACRLM